MSKPLEAGITLVELMVTITIAALFVITFSAMYLTVVKLNAAANNQALASNFGYTILRKYVNSSPANAWFDDENGLPKACDDLSSGAPKAPPYPSGRSTNDGRYDDTSYKASGTVVEEGSVSAAGGPTLPKIDSSTPARYSVNVVAPYGCAGADWGRPLKVQVDVTYSGSSRKVTHSSYASF